MSAGNCRPEIVRNYGMREVGGFGVRGFRAFCPDCDTLGELRDRYRNAERDRAEHRAGWFPTPRKRVEL